MILHKLSAPGWSKEFSSENALYVELEKHICRECLHVAGWETDYEEYFSEQYDVTLCRPVRTERLHDGPLTVDDLLSTPCGCEFDVEH